MSSSIDTVPRILFVDPQASSSSSLVDLMRRSALDVEVETDVDRALDRLRSESWGVLLSTLESDVDFLAEALILPDGPSAILLEDFGTLDDAVDAIKLGAFDCISRPAADEQILVAVQRALEQRSLAAENRRLREDLGQRYHLADIESRDPAMRRVFRTIESVADTRATLLIGGESGTGKTMLARAVHQLSGRRGQAFVEVNCGALPENLLESELFGHAKGSFTGASRDHPGKFEAADGGTLFLDEIATASPDLQVKLLRVLQDRCFERVGDTVTRVVDVRLIAATNESLPQAIAEGRFREDLYYRIQVVNLEVPALRDRPLDIPFLAQRFLERYAQEYGRDVARIAPSTMDHLTQHPWPGNVRQLEHCMERAVLLARGAVLEPGDLGTGFEDSPQRDSTPGAELPLGPLKKALEIPEKRLIQRALEANGGNRQATAALLEINRTTLFNKMRKYNLLDLPAGSEPAA